jgi:hypothetical protein
MDTEYLDRSLNQRVAAARTDYGAALDRVMRQNAAAGRLASGASLKMFSDETVGAFKAAFRPVIALRWTRMCKCSFVSKAISR